MTLLGRQSKIYVPPNRFRYFDRAPISFVLRTLPSFLTSKIAEMMIQGNTMGLTKGLRNLHSYHGKDVRVRELAHKLLATEEANIVQMKPYL